MKDKTPQERAEELYPNSRSFCGGVASVARQAYVKGCQETAGPIADTCKMIQLPVNKKLDKAEARKQITGLLDICDNVIAFGFMESGKVALLTCTEDEIYDKIALAMMHFLQQLAKEVEEDLAEDPDEDPEGLE